MRMTSGQTMSDRYRDMLSITARVAPEIEQEPYLVCQSDLPGLPAPIETGAYANPSPSPAIRQALQDAGLWRGPAPAIVFVEPLTDRLEAYGRFLHEVAHLLPFTTVADTVFTPTELATDRTAVAAWALEPDGNCACMPRWYPHHGRQYLRIVCHLWYRALRVCCLDIPVRYVVHHEYDLSPLSEYLHALGPELLATDPSMPFAEVVALPMPDSFSNLFNDDKTAWMRWKEAQ